MSGAPVGTALAVWGDPIAHSMSPQLHAAAYAALGLPWTYGRRRVSAEEFPRALAGLGPQWRGLSCTMPLKEQAFLACARTDRHARLTGAVNTLLLGIPGSAGPHGANTDVGGIVRALREQGVEQVSRARILGAGRTAASGLVALAELGARRVDVHARRPEAAAALVGLAGELGVELVPGPLDEPAGRAEATFATLPGGTTLPVDALARLAEHGGLLLDAAYAPWPTQAASAWAEAGHPVLSGRAMLLHQALLQVRLFATGDAHAALPDEAVVLAAMRAAL